MERDLRKEIVKTAKKYLGVPYLWGGNAPNGFDCSGFIEYVFTENYISIPRTTFEQVKIGEVVNKDNLKEGDIIFFGLNSLEPCHVGIYIGDSKYIYAPKTNDVVKISDLKDRNDFLIAKRIINDDNEIIIISNNVKHFIGDPKYTLYQYICNMNSDNITFRCGRFMYDKISKMTGFESIDGIRYFKDKGKLNLNGEEVSVIQMDALPKKQLIISKEYEDIDFINTEIYSNDIVLEFA